MRSLSRLLLVAAALACTRTVDRFTTAVTPAFLGAASGIYEVTSTDSVPIANGTRFLALEIRGQLVMVGQDLSAVSFAFVGPLLRDGSGGGVATGTVNLIGVTGGGNRRDTAQSFAFPVSATLTLGLDSLTLLGHDSPDQQIVPCFVTAQGCGFNLVKLCDFDPEIAGIFSEQVTATGDNGQCAGHPSLAGARQWAVATINASTHAVVLSVTNQGLEFGSVLSLDLQSRELTNVLSVPLSADVTTDPSVDFSGGITLSSAQVIVDATSLSRTYPDGCVQQYTATGTRQQGVTFATACPPSNGFECFSDFSSCALTPPAFRYASYVLTADSDTSDASSVGACPPETCTTVIPGDQLCDDPQTRLAAAGSCLLLPTPSSVAMSTRVTSNGTCLALACDATVDCSQIQSSDYGVNAPDFCAAGSENQIALHVASQSSCVVSQCQRLAPGCPPDVSCRDYTGQSTEMIDEYSGCFVQFCTLSGGPGSGSVDLTTLDGASKQLLRSGRYVVAGTQASGLPVIEAPPSNGNNPPSQGCGFPVDVDTTSYVCPLSGDVNTATESCAPSNTGPAGGLSLMFYRNLSGGEEPLVCLGYTTGQDVRAQAQPTIPYGTDCSTGSMCCIGPISPGAAPPISCGTPAVVAPTTQVQMRVALRTAGSVTVSAPMFPNPNGGGSLGDANTVTCSGGGSPTYCPLPLQALVAGYPLSMTSSGCYFDSPTTTGDYVATQGTLDSTATAIVLGAPSSIVSPLDLNIECP